MNRKKVYLAGPEVFLPDAVQIGRMKKELCAHYDLEGLFPFDNEIDDTLGEKIDLIIYRANKDMMERADFGIFNLTPFQGASADAGTVFELGLMSGMGKPCFGYTNDSRDFFTRVTSLRGFLQELEGNPLRHQSGMTIEDFGNADNLMIDCALLDSGFPIVRQNSEGEETYRSLGGFEACLRSIYIMLSEKERELEVVGSKC